MVKTLIFFTEYSAFGGHEIMSVEHAVIWSQKVNIEFYIHINNNMLINYITNNKYSEKFKIILYEYEEESKIKLYFKKIETQKFENNNIKNSIFILVSGGVGSCIYGYRIAKYFNANKIFWYIPMIQVPKRILSYFYFRLIIYLLKNVITITNFQSCKIKKYNSNTKLLILKNFIPNNKFQNKFIFNTNSKKRIRLCFIGRCHHQKNISNLISSINLYNKSNYKHNLEVELAIIGCDESTEAFRKIAKQVIGSWRLIGFPWTDNPYKHYFDGLLLPSKYEGDPLVIHECRLKMIPVFCQDLLELKEILYESEKFNFNDPNVINGIINKFDYYKLKSKQQYKIEILQNEKHILESFNFIDRIL
jgi:hypothetical protein